MTSQILNNKTLAIATAIFVAFVMLVAPAAANAATLEVNKNTGSDDGSSPFETIQAAIDAANSGDTVELQSDFTTTEQVNINKSITLDGNGNTIDVDFKKPDCDIDPNCNSNNSAIGVGSDDVTIKNVTLNDIGGGEWPLQLHGINVYTSTGVTLTNVTVTDFGGSGIVVNGSTVNASDITTSGNAWHGINVDQGDNVTQSAVLNISNTSQHGETPPIPHIFIDDISKDVAVNDQDDQYTSEEVSFDGGTAKVFTLNESDGNGPDECVGPDLSSAGGDVENTDTSEEFDTIQDAIDDCDTTDSHTIEVDDGTYNENVTVDKELTLEGANVGIPGNDGSRSSESTLDGSFKITTSNVTIDGFEITGGDVQAGEYSGVYIVQNSNNVTVQNNLLANSESGLTGRGVINEFGGVTGLEVLNNKAIGWATGVYTQNAEAIVSKNVLDGNNVGNSNDGPNGVSITNNDISNNDFEGVGVGPGDHFDISINLNNITGNQDGLGNWTDNDVDAKENWWGAEDGPSGEGSGSGDTVNENASGEVDFEPWLCGPFQDDPDTSVDGECEPEGTIGSEEEPHEGKVSICHATGSEENPYVPQEVNLNSIVGPGHGSSGVNEGDIIPPFWYEGTGNNSGIHFYEGSNWTEDNIDLWNNNCGVEQNEEAHQCVVGEELLTNGGFEHPVVETNQGWDVFANDTSGLGWTVQWISGLTHEDLPEVALIEFHRGVNNWNPFEGSQYTELDSDWDGPGGSFNGEPASTEISQSVPTVEGQWYEISFAYSPRPNVAEANNVLEVYWDGDLIDTISRAGSSNTDWSEHTYLKQATSEDTILKLVDAGEPSDSLGPFVDAVSVACVECEIAHTIFSDSQTQVNEENAFEITPHNAWTSIDGAEWIWTEEIDENGSHEPGTEVFTREFEITGTPAGATLTIAADNSYSVSVNGNFICEDLNENNFGSIDTCEIDAEDLQNGTNTITFTVENFDGSTNGNPGGLLYELVVDENQCVVPEEPEEPEEPAESYISLPENDFDTFSQGDVPLAAFYADENGDGDDAVQWAVREGTCDAGSNTVAGNVDGFNTPFSWDSINFSSTFDGSSATPGDYCFIFNPSEDSGDENQRLTRWFTIEGEDQQNPPQDPETDIINIGKWNDNDPDHDGSWGDEPGLEWDIVVKPQTIDPIETIFVDSSNENGTTTVTSLDSEKTYLIEVEGTWENQNGDSEADADYFSTDEWNSHTNFLNLGLQIDEEFVEWGSYNNDHLYKKVVEGDGEALNLRIFDGNSTTGVQNPSWIADNEGSLEVRIYEITNEMIHTTDPETGQKPVEVSEGQYQIIEIPQDGWVQTAPANPSYCHIDTETDQSLNCFFGNFFDEGSIQSDPEELEVDLEVDKTVNTSGLEGAPVTYTITVVNNGPDDATGVVVTDILPDGVTYDSHSTEDGTFDPSSGEWVIGGLDDGNSNTVTLTIDAAINSGTEDEEITNTAVVSGNEEDIDSENDTDAASFTVSGVQSNGNTNGDGEDNNGGGNDNNDEGGDNGNGPNPQSFAGGNGPIGPISFSTSAGIVLGASTESGEGQVLGDSCEPLLTTYLRRGYDNNPEEVLELQKFLQEEVPPGPRLTAVFDEMTEQYVNEFQMKYADEILVPWHPHGLEENTPTGYVYKTTRRWVNLIHCSSLNIPFPILP